jgi:hypothetical protein
LKNNASDSVDGVDANFHTHTGTPKPATNGEDRGLEPHTIRRLAGQYKIRFYEERDEQSVDAWLRTELVGHGVFPEYVGIEFSRVKDAVFARAV